MKKFDKKAIKRSFSRAALSYDESSDFQWGVARDIWERYKGLPGKSPGLTLDVGCGTGALVELITKDFPGCIKDVIGCDLSHAMLTQARRKQTEQNHCPVSPFVTADMERLPFKDSTFDTVLSSLAYQWAPNTTAAFKEAWRVLRPGGVICFSTLGPGTLKEMKECIQEAAKAVTPRFMELDDEETVRGHLESAGFTRVEIETRPERVTYLDLRHLLTTLKNIGATNPVPPEQTTGKTTTCEITKNENRLTGTYLKAASAIYRKRYPACPENPDGKVTATYEIILVNGRKP